MSNVLSFFDGQRRRKAAEDDSMVGQSEGFKLIIPVIENLRRMGLSDAEIGRFLKFLGHEFCENASDETTPPA
jgi:hypothetical protein